MGTKYQVHDSNYPKGVKDMYNSKFEFNKIETRFEKCILLRNLGLSNLGWSGRVYS